MKRNNKKVNKATKLCFVALASGFIFGCLTNCNRYNGPELNGIHVSAAYEYDIPNVDTDFKSYMDYTCITNKNSSQWKLQKKAHTDENGLRKVDDYYCVALGTYYSDTIGDIFKVTLENGNTFEVIVGDIKADKHTDSKNMYHSMGEGRGDMVEFIVETSKLPKKVRRAGTISALEEFSGSITKIEKE